MHWNWDGVDFRILHPPPLFPYLRNDSSCVLRVEAGGRVALLPGDIGQYVEMRLLREQVAEIRADLLLVPHHGSETSSTGEFIAAVAPTWAVVSAGADNRFGLPRDTVLQRYEHRKARILNTAGTGMLRFALSAEGLSLLEARRTHHPRYWRDRPDPAQAMLSAIPRRRRCGVLELIKAGGWVMLPILTLAVLALAIVVERFWSLRRKEVLPPGLGAEVRDWARKRQLDPRHIDVLRKNSPLGELLAAALDMRDRPREIMKERVEDVGRHVVHELERFMNTLGTIASVSPLLGLLGTVFGMIVMFLKILTTGVGDANQLAGGIGQALISTAGGLCVAIPAVMFHRYFRGLIAQYVVEMEKQAIALIDTLEDSSDASDPALDARSAG